MPPRLEVSLQLLVEIIRRRLLRLEPFSDFEQSLPGARLLRFLGLGRQLACAHKVSGGHGRPSRFAQPPGLGSQKHHSPEIGSAPWANANAAKTGLANRTLIWHGQFGLPSIKNNISRSAREASASANPSPDSIAAPIFS